jgi:hypothetical protein
MGGLVEVSPSFRIGDAVVKNIGMILNEVERGDVESGNREGRVMVVVSSHTENAVTSPGILLSTRQ